MTSKLLEICGLKKYFPIRAVYCGDLLATSGRWMTSASSFGSEKRLVLWERVGVEKQLWLAVSCD